MPSQRGHMPPRRVKVAFSVLVLPAPRSMVIAPLAFTEGTLNEYALGEPMCGFPSLLKRMRSIALVSVAVPTVERGFAPIRSWSTMIAVVRPSRWSTSGLASVGMKPWTNVLYVSLINRCDSAAIVPNTSELLPEPEMPVNTVRRRLGSSTLMSLRLFSRAPWTRIRSWLSAAWSADDVVRVPDALLTVAPSVVRRRSAQLLDPDHVASRVADRAVADAVRLLGRLLHDLGVAGLQPVEGAVEVLRRQQQRGVRALGHHLGDGATLVVGQAGVGRRWVEHDGGAGLVDRADRDPAHRALADVVADLEAEQVAVEGERGLGVVVREEAGVDGDVHAGHARCSCSGGAS